jgi:hypothetical protein
MNSDRSATSSLKAKYWWVHVSIALLIAYSLSYYFRWEIGLVSPSANARYFYFSNETLAPAFRVIYHPAYRVHYWLQEQHGMPDEVYYTERKDL